MAVRNLQILFNLILRPKNFNVNFKQFRWRLLIIFKTCYNFIQSPKKFGKTMKIFYFVMVKNSTVCNTSTLHYYIILNAHTVLKLRRRLSQFSYIHKIKRTYSLATVINLKLPSAALLISLSNSSTNSINKFNFKIKLQY